MPNPGTQVSAHNVILTLGAVESQGEHIDEPTVDKTFLTSDGYAQRHH